jgi:hypothetical protein
LNPEEIFLMTVNGKAIGDDGTASTALYARVAPMVASRLSFGDPPPAPSSR